MKTYLLLFTLLGFAALTGCSADDLAGPDTDDDNALAQASHEDARTSRPLSLQGAWRASDRLGGITLFLDESTPEPPSDPSAEQSFEGKGIVSGLLEAPFAVLVEGKYENDSIAFAISNAQGKRDRQSTRPNRRRFLANQGGAGRPSRQRAGPCIRPPINPTTPRNATRPGYSLLRGCPASFRGCAMILCATTNARTR